MESLFLVCFLVGLCMTALSLVLGMGHFGGIHLGHGGGHVGGSHAIGPGDGGHAAAGHGGAGTETHTLSTGFLNFTTVMTFVTWFGGVGYLIARYTALGGAAALVVAVVSG